MDNIIHYSGEGLSAQKLAEAFNMFTEKRMVKPKKFWGEPNEDPKIFLNSFIQAAKSNNWNSDSRKLNLVGNYLKGFAKNWWEMAQIPKIPKGSQIGSPTVQITIFSTKNDTSPNERCFEDEFLEMFQTDDNINGSIQDLLRLKQSKNESGVNFFSKVRNAINRIEGMGREFDDSMVRGLIMNGLRGKYIQYVDLKDPKTTHELMKTLAKADANFRRCPMGIKFNSSDEELNEENEDVKTHRKYTERKGNFYYSSDEQNSSEDESRFNIKKKKSVQNQKEKLVTDTLIELKKSIENINKELGKRKQIENNPIFALKVTDSPNNDKNPGILPAPFTQITHEQVIQIQNGAKLCYNCRQLGHLAFNCIYQCNTCANAMHNGMACPLRNTRKVVGNHQNQNFNKNNYAQPNYYRQGGNENISNNEQIQYNRSQNYGQNDNKIDTKNRLTNAVQGNDHSNYSVPKSVQSPVNLINSTDLVNEDIEEIFAISETDNDDTEMGDLMNDREIEKLKQEEADIFKNIKTEKNLSAMTLKQAKSYIAKLKNLQKAREVHSEKAKQSKEGAKLLKSASIVEELPMSKEARELYKEQQTSAYQKLLNCKIDVSFVELMQEMPIFRQQLLKGIGIGEKIEYKGNNVGLTDIATVDKESKLSFKLIDIPLEIQGKKFKAKADIGSVVSIIPIGLLQQLDYAKIVKTDGNYMFANGTTEGMMGIVEGIEIKVSPKLTIKHDFTISGNVNTPFILGIDFFYYHKGVIDANRGVIYWTLDDGSEEKTYITVVKSNIEKSTMNTMMVDVLQPIEGNVMKVVTKNDIIIDKNRPQLYNLKLERRNYMNCQYIFQTCKTIIDELQVITLPTMIELNKNINPLEWNNFADETKLIKKGSDIGWLIPAENIHLKSAKNCFEVMKIDIGILVEKHEVKWESWEHVVIDENKFDISKELSNEERKKIFKLLSGYKTLFVDKLEDMKQTEEFYHEIKLNSDASPHKVRPYRLSPEGSEWLGEYLQELLRLKLIEPSQSPWAAGVVLAQRSNKKMIKNKNKPGVDYYSGGPTEEEFKLWEGSAPPLNWIQNIKNNNREIENEEDHVEENEHKSDEYRLCIDYRPLNSMTVKDSFPIPNIDDIFNLFANMSFFSILDNYKGYWQFKTKNPELLAFTTKFGLYQWTVMPFGHTNAPAVYQRAMNKIIGDLLYQVASVFIDDITIFNKTFHEHLSCLAEVCERLANSKLSLNRLKCKFGYSELLILGYLVGKEGIKTNPDTVKRILNWPNPTNVKEVRGFFGISQYYRRFIKNFAVIAKPLTVVMSEKRKFYWGEDQENAFLKLKKLLTTTPVLAHPNFSKEFILYLDASNTAIGAVLSQFDENNFDHPIHFASRMLNEAEKNYSTYEKEFLALVHYTLYFRVYLIGRHFIIYTDHQALRYVYNMPKASIRVLRWIMRLSEFDFEVRYREGKSNINGDVMSRYPFKSIEISKGLEEVYEIEEIFLVEKRKEREERCSKY